jgi:hypothetical protein
MTNPEFVLSRDRRDEIMKAVAAIGRQLKVMVGESQPHTPSLMVIVTNPAIIQTNLTNLPRASSN